jgi:steroid delta-isomerase-like uncharacterized protein
MSVAQNKEMLRRLFEEGLNRGNLDIIAEHIGDDYVNHNLPAPAPGREGFRQVVQMFLSAFPDMQVTLHDIFGDGDKVGARGSWRGTHEGEFMGIPATGKHVEVQYIDIWRVEDGKFVDNWVQMDLLGLMQQLGVGRGA